MEHGDAREEKWMGNKRMEWVTSKRHMTAEHWLARAVQTLQADVHNSPASSRLNWGPRRFKWTRPFRRKTKSGFCACVITFQTQSTSYSQRWYCDMSWQLQPCNWTCQTKQDYAVRLSSKLRHDVQQHLTNSARGSTCNIVLSPWD
jgi:hypothetical protein